MYLYVNALHVYIWKELGNNAEKQYKDRVEQSENRNSAHFSLSLIGCSQVGYD